MKVRIPQTSALTRFFLSRAGRILLISCSLITIGALATFTYFYARYARIIDERLRAGVFANSAKIFAAPESVSVGDTATPLDIATQLRRSGYSESRGNPVGYYQTQPDSISIYPGPDSYFDQEAGVIRFRQGRIAQIVSLQDNTARTQYQLEPQLIQAISGSREKRRMVRFRDLPKLIVDAVTSIEDKRFFQHSGFDPIRIIKAAYIDVREGRMAQGSSTLSMQTARMFFLTQDKSWRRKIPEAIITLQLEQRLSKEDIFEYYANQVPLGRRGTFDIRGLGQASEAYLGKELSTVTLPEAAQIAGMIQRPGYFDPFRHPERVKERRNVVLQLMRQNGVISDRDYAMALDAPLTVAKTGSNNIDAPYFVDMVNDTLQTMLQDADLTSNAYRIYTTIDMRLQRAASEAIATGMALVDEQIKKQRRFKGQTPPTPQVALVAIDPHTGEVKALAGGRNYGVSQLNHVTARRQPGSIFKPFVYAAALDTALTSAPRVITASTSVLDEPTTFYFDNQEYSPKNFDKKFLGPVSVRYALAHSLNVPTVKIAEMTGFDNVVEMANRAGMNYRIRPTPAVALGAYDITPLEAAGAYTMFANQGEYVKPSFLSLVRAADGKVVYKNAIESKQVLDPRVAYLVTNLMEEVLRTGTGGAVRPRYNFTVPAAGKTGTSRDGWFAGFTSELECIVWVGFDDSRDLDLEGAKSAAPIWGEFMSRALNFREYRDAKPFRAPSGIVSVEIDPESGYLATVSCIKHQTEVYIAGTEPVNACPIHGGRPGITTVAGWDSTAPPAAAPPANSAPSFSGSGGDGLAPADPAARRAARQASGAPPPPPPVEKQETDKKQKKGIFQRIFGVFK
jgi:penicillin-binding protein 1B